MPPIVLAQDDYRDRVYACWLGKNIGGALGAPFEGRKYVNDLDFYDPVPNQPLPNDDLDFQLVWLAMLEERGPAVGLPDFTDRWRRHLSAYPWNEYGLCLRNLERGLQPPISGWFENYYVDEMGSPIRSEIWACIAPADPQRAAALAWMDSALDHAGGEGMWGEMFWAALESAAFVISDPRSLIHIGLAMIPPACNIARVAREALWLRDSGARWPEARERIVRVYGNDQPCNAIQNCGFTLLGWLYGEDFGDSLCRAVNCGYDTDCTGATLGSLLGILGGRAAIPARWSDPVGDRIILHPFTRNLEAPATLEELTARTTAVAERFARAPGARVGLGERADWPDDLLGLLLRSEEAEAALAQDLRAGVARDREVELTLHYHGEPVLIPGVARHLTITCRRDGQPLPTPADLDAPAGWTVRRQGDAAFLVTPADYQGAASLRVRVRLNGEEYAADFAALSPDLAPGFPSATNVQYCPTCRGRAGACLCGNQDASR